MLGKKDHFFSAKMTQVVAFSIGTSQYGSGYSSIVRNGNGSGVGRVLGGLDLALILGPPTLHGWV